MPDDIKLPELPEPDATYGHDFWMAGSMMAYARAAVEADRASRVPLTDEQLRTLHHEDEFGLFCSYSEFEQIVRAIEAAHGIPAPKGGSDA